MSSAWPVVGLALGRRDRSLVAVQALLAGAGDHLHPVRCAALATDMLQVAPDSANADALLERELGWDS